MGTLKRKNADGNWEYIQVSGLDVAQLQDQVNTNTSDLAEKANKEDIKYVTYEMFEAPLNGIGDDTQAVINCHNYANANNLKVVQNTGTIYLKSTATLGNPVIKTDTDLTGASILIDQTMSNNNLYLVDSDQPKQTVTVTPTIQNDLVEGAIKIPSLSQYKFSVFNVVSDQVLGKRDDTNNTPYYCQEPFTVGTNGVLLDGALLLGYTTGTLTLTYRSILDKAITIRGAKILINTTDKDHLARVFQNYRSNVTFTDLRIVVQSMPVNNTAVYNFKNALIATYEAYNVTYDKFIGENASAPLSSPTDTTQGQYVFLFGKSSKNRITNCHVTNGWINMDTEFIKDMVVRDSVLNCYDNHWGMSDLLIDNLRVVGNNGGIKLGWGKGTAIIKNCKTDYTAGNSTVTGEQFAVGTKPDLGLVYEGKIIIDNYDLNIHEDVSTFNFFQMNLNKNVAFSTTRQMKLPDIDIRKVTVDAKKVSSSINVYGVYVDIGGSSFVGKNITRGKTKIKDFTLVNETKDVRKLGLYRYVNAVPDAINPNIPQVIDIEDCGNLSKSAYNTNVPLIQIQEANTTTSTKSKVRLKNCVGKIQIGANAVIDVDAFKFIGEMSRNSDPITAQFNNVVLDNCDISYFLGGVNVTCYNNTNIDTFYVDVLKNVNMTNCTVGGDIAPSTVTTATYKFCTIKPNTNGVYTAVQLQNMVMKFCEVQQVGSLPVAIDSSTNAPILMQGNVIKGVSKDQGTTDLLYKYIKSGTFAQPTVAV